MRERPILFSAAMVRSILAETKSQTRRAMNPQPRRVDGGVPFGDAPAWAHAEPGSMVMRCPYGKRGDRLRVKEAAWMWCERRPNGKTKAGRDKWLYVPMREAPVRYAADLPARPAVAVVSPDTGNQWGWRLKIGLLPAWASRITLEVTGVRVERLQDISEEDAIAEGIYCLQNGQYLPMRGGFSGGCLTARTAYSHLRNEINGAGSWEANPWVWAVEFRRIESEAAQERRAA